MCYTYVLQSTKDGKGYTGFTGDLQKALHYHSAGQDVMSDPRLQIESGVGTAKVTFDVLFKMLVALGFDYKVVTRKAA